MRHYLPCLARTAGASLALAPPAAAQAASTGREDMTLVLLVLILIAVAASIVMRRRTVPAKDPALDEMREELARIRARVDPEIPEGASGSLQDRAARAQRANEDLVASANAVQKEMAEALRQKAEAEKALAKERADHARTRQALEAAKADLATTKEHLREAEEDLREFLDEHRATGRPAAKAEEFLKRIEKNAA